MHTSLKINNLPSWERWIAIPGGLLLGTAGAVSALALAAKKALSSRLWEPSTERSVTTAVVVDAGSSALVTLAVGVLIPPALPFSAVTLTLHTLYCIHKGFENGGFYKRLREFFVHTRPLMECFHANQTGYFDNPIHEAALFLIRKKEAEEMLKATQSLLAFCACLEGSLFFREVFTEPRRQIGLLEKLLQCYLQFEMGRLSWDLFRKDALKILNEIEHLPQDNTLLLELKAVAYDSLTEEQKKRFDELITAERTDALKREVNRLFHPDKYRGAHPETVAALLAEFNNSFAKN